MIITPEMSRAARALLDWDQQALATAAGVSLRTLKRAELGCGRLAGTDKTIEGIARAFEAAGVTFENGRTAIGARLLRSTADSVKT